MSARRDREHDLSRRSLIRWSLAAGAALGIGRSRIFEVLERSAGRGVAEAAAAVTTKRSVHLRAPIGGFAWFQLMWPHNAVARAANPAFAWHAAPGATVDVAGTYHPLTIGPETPFAALLPELQITAIMAGRNEAHEANPTSIVRSLNGSSLFAIAASLQSTNPSVIPVITLDDQPLGSAPGAPPASVVPRGTDIVNLFNSAASRAGGLLAQPGNPESYRASYAALAGLNRAADRSTTQEAYATGRKAAQFVGVNLAEKLAITDDDRNRYGLNVGGLTDDVINLGETLIVTAKAFQYGLTQSVVVSGPRDDPHTAFTSVPTIVARLTAMKVVLDAFMADLTRLKDDATGVPLIDDFVLTIDGDTPKSPIQISGGNDWVDGTPGDSNWIYVYSGGLLRSGWFGGVGTDGAITGFDPTTGELVPDGDGDAQAKAAVAAITYAIAKGDDRRVQDFTREEYRGLIRSP